MRVQQTGTNGREIVLYRVQRGESCVLTTSCLLAHAHYAAQGVSETPVHAVAIPAARFHEGLNRSEGFRNFVFQGYGQRLADLMLLVEEVAFDRLEARLARRLLALASGRRTLDLTHQALAVEIGSAREVVSRQLKDFERHGWVRLARGHIEILDHEALAALDAV